MDALDTWLRVSWITRRRCTETIAEYAQMRLGSGLFVVVRHRIEIIPLEPDQRSYLRREAPVSPLSSSPFAGDCYSILTCILSYPNSKDLVTNRFALLIMRT